MYQVATNSPIDVFSDTHILSSVALITEASALADSGSAAVLGCGYCGEIPTRLLNEKFDVLDLVDIDEDALSAVSEQCKHWNDKKNDCRFHHADLTGMIATVTRRATERVTNKNDPIECLEQLGVLLESATPKFWTPPQTERYDLLVCSTLLTQLQAVVRENVERIYLARFPEYAAALVKHEPWRKSAWNFARNLEVKFLAHLTTLIKPQGIVYLSETVHVSWLTQLDEQSVSTEGSWITLRTSRLADYLCSGETIIKEHHWNWLRQEDEGDFWGRLYRVQAITYRIQ